MRLRHFATILSAVSALSFAAAACSEPSQSDASAEASFEPPPPVESSALPDDAVATALPTGAPAPALIAEAEKGEKGARNVLLTWARALETRDFATAYAQWGESGRRSGTTAQGYAARFARYRRLTIGFGDGAVEGAAGSLYYEVPVDLKGVRDDGAAVARAGTIVLRRVNDVPGATPEQLRWRIDSTTLEP